MRIILASKSPARLATLQSAGVFPEVFVSGVNESSVTAATPAKLALKLAQLKGEAVLPQLTQPGDEIILFACDSVLEFNGSVRGKPTNTEQAKSWWQSVAGKSGILHTGHLVGYRDELGVWELRQAVASTIVHFASLTETEIDAYLTTEEPLWVAGGFTIDGLGGPFITGIEGDHHNVVGISLPLIRELLLELGIAWPQLWQSHKN